MSASPGYWERTAPGEGRRAPRADALSDARRLSLNGTWRFRLAPTAAGTGEAFVEDDVDDRSWDEIRVPSHWVLEPITPLAGGPARSLIGDPEGPLYTNTALPIPLDPPRVPTENPTGDYRLVFDAPVGWTGSVLRFQGVDSCAKVWLNGDELGFSTGSRLPFEFDVALRPGKNVLAVRVHRWSSGTYLEDQDMWWLPGIFRDVELIERPAAAIDDHTVITDFDAETGEGMLRVDAVVPSGATACVRIPELDIDAPAGALHRMPVEPWSADAPRLYRGTLSTDDETIELAIGFRRIEIVDGILLANGRPLQFHGVNRHEHDPVRGRALDHDTMVRDIILMKRANIDAVRTSHYPPHPDFLRLCDEYGLWVVEECDLETHGFIYAGWVGNPPADPDWLPAMQDRIARMVERDKNHPSVVVWSMANESDAGENFAALERWIRERDPSRPVLYERDRSYRHSDFASQMYPSLEDLDAIGRGEEPRPDGVSDHDDARRRRLPFLLVEYAHAMGNGPGSLQDYQRVLDAHPRLCGGFVWEWIDHGFDAVSEAGQPFTLHAGAIDYRPSGGRYCLDGLVFSDRTPTPGLAELAKAYEPVRIAIDDAITIDHRRQGTDTADLDWRWHLADDGATVAEGALVVPAIAPGGLREIPLPPLPPTRGEATLTVVASLRHATSWAPRGHIVAWGQRSRPAAPPVDRSGPAAVPLRHDGMWQVGPARIDATTGRLTAFGPLALDGPWLDVHRAPIENDRGQGGVNDLAAVWAATGIDRMVPRIDEVRPVGDAVEVRGRLAPSTHAHAVAFTMTYRADGEAVVLTTSVQFTGPWEDTPFRHRHIVLPRLGLRFRLPGALECARWFGRGPGETYVDSREAARLGRWSATVDELQVPYPVPQENGNHTDTRWLEMTDAVGRGIRVDGPSTFDFTARRWTSHDLQRARFPHDLADSGSVWLNVDHRQIGLGSASVGPALPERYRIPLTPTSWSVRLSPQRTG